MLKLGKWSRVLVGGSVVVLIALEIYSHLHTTMSHFSGNPGWCFLHVSNLVLYTSKY